MADGFTIWPPWEDVLGAAGITSVAHALERSTCIRDLPDRSNHELVVGGRLVHLKRKKPVGRRRRPPANPEKEGLLLGARLGLPVPDLVLAGEDPGLGALVGTLGLAPARPLDDLLCEGRLARRARRRIARELADGVAALHRAGVHHRDLYLNHVFADPERVPSIRGVIDWERCGAHRRPTGRWVVKDLASLLASVPAGTVTPRETLAFLARYARAAGLGRPKRRRLARRVARKADRIRRHSPRTPVGDAARPGAGGRA